MTETIVLHAISRQSGTIVRLSACERTARSRGTAAGGASTPAQPPPCRARERGCTYAVQAERKNKKYIFEKQNQNEKITFEEILISKFSKSFREIWKIHDRPRRGGESESKDKYCRILT